MFYSKEWVLCARKAGKFWLSAIGKKASQHLDKYFAKKNLGFFSCLKRVDIHCRSIFYYERRHINKMEAMFGSSRVNTYKLNLARSTFTLAGYLTQVYFTLYARKVEKNLWLGVEKTQLKEGKKTEHIFPFCVVNFVSPIALVNLIPLKKPPPV